MRRQDSHGPGIGSVGPVRPVTLSPNNPDLAPASNTRKGQVRR
nr:hypothetical protein [Brevibacillus laterosporus]